MPTNDKSGAQPTETKQPRTRAVAKLRAATAAAVTPVDPEAARTKPVVPKRLPMKANDYTPALGTVLVLPDDIPLLPHFAKGREILAAMPAGYANASTLGPGGRPRLTDQESTLPPSQGGTGLVVSNGRIQHEYNTALATFPERMVAFEEMRRSSTASAVIEKHYCQPVMHTDYWVDPGDYPQLARFLQWNLEECLTIPFSETVRQGILTKLYGVSWHYKRYQPLQFEGREWVGWRQFAPRSRATIYKWLFQEDGGLNGLIQYGQNPLTMQKGYVDYSIEDLIVWTWRPDDGDPEGLGEFRQMYRSYKQEDAFSEFAGIRIERSAMGIPIASGPPGYTVAEETAVLKIMHNIRCGEDAGIAKPDGWEIELLDLGPADVPFEAHIERQRGYQLQVGQVQDLALGQGGDSGSLGQGKDASAGRAMFWEFDADWICEQFNHYALWPLCRMNIGVMEGRKPRLMHGRVGIKDTQAYVRGIELMYRNAPNGIPEHIQRKLEDVQGLPPKAVAAQQEDEQANEIVRQDEE